MNSNDLNWAAGELLTAQSLLKAREPLANRFPDIKLVDGYQIQLIGRGLRIKAGAKQIGWKMGLTSESKRKQMNLSSSIFGYLLDVGQHSKDPLPIHKMIHPKVECEIGFRMKSALKGKITTAQALDAVESVHGALEYIDSRYIGFKYFSLPDVVADNCSAGMFQFSAGLREFKNLDLKNLQMELLVNDECVQSLLSSEISGDPTQSICELSEMMAQYDLAISPGDLILAGAAGPAIEMKAGNRYELRVAGLPTLKVST